jgi:NADH dehydrogenase/NADH:ubiquinone oxidoreductase subunit G
MDSELFGNYEKLLHVDILGRQLEMPEHNTILRGLQFAAPQSISYGRFCWNGTCNNCTVTVRNDSCESKALACRMDACDGMHVTSASPEIKRLLV